MTSCQRDPIFCPEYVAPARKVTASYPHFSHSPCEARAMTTCALPLHAGCVSSVTRGLGPLPSSTAFQNPDDRLKPGLLLFLLLFLSHKAYNCKLSTLPNQTNLSLHPTSFTITMATTIQVKNIGEKTDDKEIRDFFSFW